MSYARLLPVVVERNILTFAYEANQNLREIVINCAYNIQVTILTLRLNVRSFISVPQLTRVSSLQSPSSAPMEPSSTRTTSSATGGSTLIALRLRVSIPRMRKLLPKERLQQVRPPMQLRPHLDIHLGQQPLQMATPRGPCLLWPHRVPRVPMRRLKGPAESLETRERTEMKVSARAENISLSLLCPRAALLKINVL